MNTIIIEDDLIKRFMLTEFIKEYTTKIDIATSISEAIPLLANNQYAFIFIDHHLPDGKGSEIISTIEQQQTESKKISISYDLSITENYLKHGYDDVITYSYDQSFMRVFNKK